MQIANDKVVMIHYTLTNEEGDLLDSSKDQDPLAYLHGFGNIIPGLEKALTGRSIGDTFKIEIAPEDGYGVRDNEMVQSVPRSAFEGVDDIEPGMQFQAQSPDGIQLVTVIDIDGDEVILDGNHPMAGITLHFDVEVTDIREATHEELEHGHVHGAGGHHH
ncbi:MAG: peptidylprolyl isomerase [Gammaproteobacteria bacterium]|jgi:FKBP-type peptidyl-prolyl cis-trans isomerase SlyD|nr:peptidylprolyl isomerase [Gammaproteobacteria bacterium]NBT43761.1 peptidylprolyl isomerase [Gammaproteobacteria bacterium]NBY24102.1 peptidylprolyl isomerase [Gammaproteobacteria bacterium]NDE34376.1 peptidylprolyl isomerase [Gammaproteobacteria bacterium]NDE56319.1 peptidylprolyl isomerase [Gammaproteobacteria bacterium]